MVISCSNFHSTVFFTFYHVYISFHFDFQSHMNFRIQSHAYVSHFSFSLIKTHIFYLIQVILIVIIFQNFWCFMIHSTSFFGFIKQDLFHSIVNNSVVFLIFLESFPWYGFSPAVLIRLGYSILSPKLPQCLTFIGIMSMAVDEAGFRFAIQAIYISFTALTIAPIRHGVSIWRCGLSSIITT